MVFRSNKSIDAWVFYTSSYVIEDQYKVNKNLKIMLVSFKYPDHKDTQKSLGLMLDLPKNFSKNEVGLSGRIHDLKSEFVFEVFHQLKDDSRLDGEYIFKNTIFQTTHDIEVGNFFKINGYFQVRKIKFIFYIFFLKIFYNKSFLIELNKGLWIQKTGQWKKHLFNLLR